MPVSSTRKVSKGTYDINDSLVYPGHVHVDQFLKDVDLVHCHVDVVTLHHVLLGWLVPITNCTHHQVNPSWRAFANVVSTRIWLAELERDRRMSTHLARRSHSPMMGCGGPTISSPSGTH